jgi:hypothetical protein
MNLEAFSKGDVAVLRGVDRSSAGVRGIARLVVLVGLEARPKVMTASAAVALQ